VYYINVLRQLTHPIRTFKELYFIFVVFTDRARILKVTESLNDTEFLNSLSVQN